MKSKSIISSLLITATVLSLCVGVSAAESPISNHNAVYKPIQTLPSVPESNSALYVTQDMQGNLLGPSDFSVDGSSVYVLNTANNSIYQYQGNTQVNNIALDAFDVIGTALSVHNGTIYVLNNSLSVSKINNGTEECIGSVQEEMDFDNAIDFKATPKYMYVSEPTSEGGETHRYFMDPTSGDLTFDRTINGYMVDENTFYRSRLITETGENAGHECVITLLNADGRESETITLHSDNYIAGAQYLGTNDDGMHIVKQYDMSCYADGSCDVEETIRTVNKDNSIISCELIKNNVPSMDNPVNVQDGKVYQFSSTNAGATINVIQTEKMSTAKFCSNLEKSASAINSVTSKGVSIEPKALVSLSRSAVLNNAKSYHSSFTWSCTSNNLAALTNWKRPRYVNGAGSYSYMPYCWGGFSSTSQYRTGMRNSGRVGNINTSTSGHVANTYGLDCSGYVSRCWGQSTKYGTSTIGSICNSISYNALRSADALNKSGSHIVLFDYSDGAGHYTLYEATTLNQYDRVSHTSRVVSNLSSGGYVALRYKGITN